MKETSSLTKPKKTKLKVINVEEYIKLAKKVREGFEKDREVFEKQQKRSSSSTWTDFLSSF